MSSILTLLVVVSMLVSIAVGASPIQTEIVTNRPSVWPTAQPQLISTYKTIVNSFQVGNRNGVVNSSAGPLIKLTPCAQAILGCCASEIKDQQNCFQEIGCGPHIFGNPCDRAFMNQALGGAERFYNQFIPTTSN